jgi:hypothetical protein
MSLLVWVSISALFSLPLASRCVIREAECESFVHPAIGGLPELRYADTRGLGELDTAGLSVTVRPTTTQHAAPPAEMFPDFLGL